MTEQESIVRYWHAVELLQPQSAPKVKRRSNHYSAYIHDLRIGEVIPPWSAASIVSRQYLPKRRVWSHTLFAHLYDSRKVAEQLKKAFGADQGYREPQSRESALFAAKFTMEGQFVNDSFVLSSEAWFLGRVLAGKDWTHGFDDDQRALGDKAKELLEGRVSGDALRELTLWTLQYLGLAGFFRDIDLQVFRFRSQPVNPNKLEPEDDPLNSFLLDDLATVASSIANDVKSEPLNHYLRQHDSRQRLHVDDDRLSLSLINRLMPDAYAVSCWPSERHLGLVHSQQLAVNTILGTLGNAQGLLGINGPPGTGKTTLLRDLIAAIVTDRADALSKLKRASDGFIGNGREEANDGGKQHACFKLNQALYGFEIVVASSNNGAVENVTLELPQRDKIDESWLPEAEYFAELGELVSGKPAWGLIAGALGSKARRTKFVERYFYGQRPFGSDDKAAPEAEDEAELDDEFGDALNAFLSTPSTAEENPGTKEDLAEAPADKEEGPKGFLGWLNVCAEVNKTRSPEQRQEVWQLAVADYEASKIEEHKARAVAIRIRELIQALCKTKQQVTDQSESLRAMEMELADAVNQLSRLDAEESRPASIALKHCLDELEEHQARKPGFWVKVFSLWGAKRDWDAKRKWLEGQHDLAKSEFSRIARLTKQLDATRESLEKQITDTQRGLQRLRDQCQAHIQAAIDVARDGQADHLLTWLQDGAIGRGGAIELAEPWCIEGWRQARARVFIQALKLHRVFFELEASRMRSNLFLINGMLTGTRYQGPSRDAIRSAWASLFMVVPVLSSTFASFARSFGSLGASEIGWLLVDEAGQAAPQAAVGALWRSRRALLVGDPLQLKPIVTVSDAVLEHMRTRYQVDTHWLPNRQSAQTLADEATRWGRMAGPADGKTWVGLPLVVHRRCDKPMHALANRIAYDGAMVYGTFAPRPDKETPASLPTGWIQASGTSQGNWVPAEGKALQELLSLLHEDGVEANDIAVITPFKTVQENLKRMLRNKMVFGTIHTMQGKEASVVIVVLGGNTVSPAARDWVVSEPNLLNVAATRAKRRLYVIGDREDWRNRALFSDVMDILPLQTVLEQE
ncbi:AAA domain-containing protein [Marinobacterium stanieri]|uniref:Part of AAA domain-containing protein n=1 Tax=Marinobacterium stanieri TaxID=49186 RepID=A0A1N6XBF8_9GAMM|nr:AAA domain-containing protein [Marinobacterium stanieri]SIQ99692.1 Part of AAA domain-containing protein [Marinobacterium stanieri]